MPGPYHLLHVGFPQIKEVLENPELLAAATAASSAPAAGGGDAKEEESDAKKEESEEEEDDVSPPPSLRCHVYCSATVLSAHCSAVSCLDYLTILITRAPQLLMCYRSHCSLCFCAGHGLLAVRLSGAPLSLVAANARRDAAVVCCGCASVAHHHCNEQLCGIQLRTHTPPLSCPISLGIIPSCCSVHR